MKITGRIIHGSGRGKSLGFPTINVEVHSFDSLPFGVYAAWVNVEDQIYAGALHYGPRPTFGERKPILEIHLLDFQGNLYEKRVEAEIVKKIRNISIFKSREGLQLQIRKDLEKVRYTLFIRSPKNKKQ